MGRGYAFMVEHVLTKCEVLGSTGSNNYQKVNFYLTTTYRSISKEAGKGGSVAAHPEDSGSIPSTHMAALHILQFQNIVWPPQEVGVQRHKCRQTHK